MSSPCLRSLLAGLALGAGVAAGWRHFSSPAASATEPSTPARAREIPAPSPRLAAVEADSALAAWLALGPLTDDASPADFAARAARLRALLTILPDSHFEELLAAFATRPDAAEARLRRVAFDVWIERDAPAAARWARALAPGEAIDAKARERHLGDALRAWAEQDFAAAYAWLDTVPDAKLADRLARLMIVRLLADDPVRAMTLARARGDKFVADNRRSLFDAYAKLDPAAAMRELGAELQKNDLHNSHVQNALLGWLAREPGPAFEWIVSRVRAPDMENSHLLESLSWSVGRDSATARAFADQLSARPDLENRGELLRNLLFQWVPKDRQAALAWIDTVPEAERRHQLIEQVLPMLPPDGFFDYVERLPDGPARATRIENFVANWAQDAPEQALAWVAAHGDSPELLAAVARAQGAGMVKLAATDPAAALVRWETLPPEAGKAEAAGPLARAWAQNDPLAAAAWLAPQLGDNGLDADASRQLTHDYLAIVGKIALSDPESLMRLAGETADPTARQTAYNALANDMAIDMRGPWERTSVPHARRAELLATIPEEKIRATMLGVLLGSWLRRDYDGARAWIDTHDAISPEAAARLIDSADPLAPGSAFIPANF